MDVASIEHARLKLGEIVDRARLAGQPTLITRQGKPAAVVVNEEWYSLALGFIERIAGYEGWEVVHKDGDAANNDISNLELRKKP